MHASVEFLNCHSRGQLVQSYARMPPRAEGWRVRAAIQGCVPQPCTFACDFAMAVMFTWVMGRIASDCT